MEEGREREEQGREDMVKIGKEKARGGGEWGERKSIPLLLESVVHTTTPFCLLH